LNFGNFEFQILYHSRYVIFGILIVQYIVSVRNACLGILSYRDCACRDFAFKDEMFKAVKQENQNLRNEILQVVKKKLQ
jgi:hypothetical protein